MIDAQLRELASRQQDVVATWQLRALGWTDAMVRHRLRGVRRLHDGVYLLGHSAPAQRQRWLAASLTTPDSTLSLHAAGASYGIRPVYASRPITVVRPGAGGPVRIGTLLVSRSRVVPAGDVRVDAGLRRTTVERTLVDLAAVLRPDPLRKAFREALRLRLTTALLVLETVNRHRGRRGIAGLRVLAERYARLPFDRCRSDAEAMALELSDEAGRPIPKINVIVAGEEADQYYPELHRIIEINGPGFHLLMDEDARKTGIWRAAGLQVDRISSGDVFDYPERYLELAPPPQLPAQRQSPVVRTTED
jgi:hypothetical protein